MKCAHCSADLDGNRGRKYCDAKCRDAAAWERRKERGYTRPGGYPCRDVPCADCGKPTTTTPGQSSAAPMCRPCRTAFQRANSKARYLGRPKGAPCRDCGLASYGLRCRSCDNARRRDGSTPNEILERKKALRDRRNARMQQAPGLNPTALRGLRAKWIKQGRVCAYCAEPATQVDHVVPLALGGTNHEGNLTPCCGACNRAKSDNLLIEWKNGKRGRHFHWTPVVVIPREPRPPKAPKFAGPKPLKICPICSALHPRPTYCSVECGREGNRRLQRDRYRAKVGIPVDPAMPTKRWAA